MQPPPPVPIPAPSLPVLPASTPWWGVLALALATLLIPAIVQLFLHRRKTAGLAKLLKDVAAHGSTLTEHGATLAALKQRAEEGPEKTDPAIVHARESQRQGLEQRVQRLEQRADVTDGELRELKAKIERRAEDDAKADAALRQQLGRIEGYLEAQNGNGSRSRRG